MRPIQLGRFRKALGEEGMEELLARTIEVAVTLKISAEKVTCPLFHRAKNHAGFSTSQRLGFLGQGQFKVNRFLCL